MIAETRAEAIVRQLVDLSGGHAEVEWLPDGSAIVVFTSLGVWRGGQESEEASGVQASGGVDLAEDGGLGQTGPGHPGSGDPEGERTGKAGQSAAAASTAEEAASVRRALQE